MAIMLSTKVCTVCVAVTCQCIPGQSRLQQDSLNGCQGGIVVQVILYMLSNEMCPVCMAISDVLESRANTGHTQCQVSRGQPEPQGQYRTPS